VLVSVVLVLAAVTTQRARVGWGWDHDHVSGGVSSGIHRCKKTCVCSNSLHQHCLSFEKLKH
jgi:hypothetical protein